VMLAAEAPAAAATAGSAAGSATYACGDGDLQQQLAVT
jgi:hypothetical protein